MAKIRSTDEPVGRMAKLMAKMYYFMAKEMIDRLGEEEGKAAVRAAVTKFGKSRIESMYEEAREQGLEINLDTYKLVRDMPGISWEKDPDNPDDITYCPMQDMWAGLDAQELGAIYCEIDDVLYDGFNAEMERPLCMTHNDCCCRFIVRPKAKQEQGE